jgi:hypothetical protein
LLHSGRCWWRKRGQRSEDMAVWRCRQVWWRVLRRLRFAVCFVKPRGAGAARRRPWAAPWLALLFAFSLEYSYLVVCIFYSACLFLHREGGPESDAHFGLIWRLL